MKTKTQKIVFSALLAAVTCVMTFIIRIPTPLKGYMNLGDAAVLLSSSLLPPAYAFLSAGLGSALADASAGYMVYVPATFLIKGIMTYIVSLGFKFFKKCKFFASVLSYILAEFFMILGYYVFEGFLYGFKASIVNIPANAFQGLVAIIVSTVLYKFLHKIKITK